MLAGFEVTSETISTWALEEQLGLEPGEAYMSSHHQVCAGVYLPEKEGGTIVRWRFYKDPEWEN